MKQKSLEKYKLELKEQPLTSGPNFKKICCAACNEEVPAEDININDKIAKCVQCNVVFSFAEELQELGAPKRMKQELIRPEGIDLFHFRNELDITIQQPWTILEIFGTIFLPLFATIFTILFIKEGISVLWLVLFWLATLFSIINIFLRIKHKVHVTIDDQYLSVHWRPQKLHKDKHYAIGQIDQLYTKGIDGGHSIRMIINGVNGQKHVSLISGLKSISKAHYLEQEIERHLGIVDRKVPEER